MFDQMRLKVAMMEAGIKVKRTTMEEMHKNTTIDEEGNVFYGKQPVSIVYYRLGHRNDHFKVNGNPQLGWKLKEDLELSKAYCIPPIDMELINQKRMQA